MKTDYEQELERKIRFEQQQTKEREVPERGEPEQEEAEWEEPIAMQMGG